MRFDVLTLFPDMVRGVLNESIIGRAQSSGLIEVKCHNIRDYSTDKHKKTDDTPYGGGVGMAMTCQPIYDCFRAATADIPEGKRQIPASIAFVPSVVGLIIAGEVIKDLIKA